MSLIVGAMVGMIVESISGFFLIISTLALELLGFAEELLGNVIDEEEYMRGTPPVIEELMGRAADESALMAELL